MSAPSVDVINCFGPPRSEVVVASLCVDSVRSLPTRNIGAGCGLSLSVEARRQQCSKKLNKWNAARFPFWCMLRSSRELLCGVHRLTSRSIAGPLCSRFQTSSVPLAYITNRESPCRMVPLLRLSLHLKCKPKAALSAAPNGAAMASMFQ